MKGALLVVVLLAVAAPGCRPEKPGPPPAADPSSRRTLAGGEVVGFTGRYGSHVWLGIPYAKPPTGELRWRAPEPPAPWAGTRDALDAPPVCPQFPSPFGIEEGSAGKVVGEEDCLYLNVHAPRFAPGEIPPAASRLPVLFWIHGGGNVIGHASFYDGGALATRERVVVVALNYRLGPFGWFRHEALRASAPTAEDRSGNYGTLDLVRGLEWVRENAAAFGGDPGNVTIFGESAGARNVVSLLLSPRAAGLFHRAIVQSGGTDTLPVARAEAFGDGEPSGHRNSSNEILLRLLSGDGGARDRSAAHQALEAMSAARIEAFLRERSPQALLRAYQTEAQEGLIEVPQLFRDGTVLPDEDPLEVLRRGGSARVPVILGTNRDENKLFLAVNPGYVRRLFWLIPMIRDPLRYEATAEHLSLLWKATGADRPAAALRETHGDVWVYRFDWDEEPDFLWVDVSRLLGAAHAFEIPFVFGHWDLGSPTRLLFDDGNEAGRLALSATMMGYWTDFARSGDPNGGSRPRWERYEPDPGWFLVFDTPAGGGVRMESGRVTVEEVLAAVDADPRLPNQRARCDVYRRLVEWNRAIPRERYDGLGAEGCREFPLDEPVFQ